jgi:hypothetical protein
MTMIPLANVTLSSAASSITFGSIPTSVNGVALRDLYLVVNGTFSVSAQPLLTRINNNTSGSNHTSVVMLGESSGAISAAYTNDFWFISAGNMGTGNFVATIQLMDYSATDKHKSALSRNNYGSAGSVQAAAHRFASTNAITTVQVFVGTGLFAIGSTFALWGIA